MTEYITSSYAFREHMSSRDRTARWVRSHSPTESKFYSPSLPPFVTDELVPSSPPSEAGSSHSMPPKMVLRYGDGRPDIPIPPPALGHAMGEQDSKVYRNPPQTSASRVTRVKLGSSSESPVFTSSSRHDLPIFSRSPSSSSESDTNNSSMYSSLSGSTNVHAGSTSNPSPLPSAANLQPPIAESPFREAAAESQESVDISPLIISSEIVSHPPSVEETQNPTGDIPPVIDSTVGDPGVFTNVIDIRQPDIAQDPQAVAPYIIEPMAKSSIDFEPVDHANNTDEFNEAVHGNANIISRVPFADPVTSRITQPVLDIPQYVNLELPTTSPTN